MEADSAGLDRPFVCDYCPKKYLRKNNLEDHVLMEHPDTEQASDIIKYKARNGRSKGSLIIQCEICNKRFRYQSDLKNHVESHFRGRGRGSRGSGISRGSAPPSRAGHRGSSRGLSPRRGSSRGGRGYSTRGSVSEYPCLSLLTRTRPCLYCGKTFFDKAELYRHEETEAEEFERDAMHFETDNKMKINQSMFESQVPNLDQEIDRTDEEFGDEYRVPTNLKVEIKSRNSSSVTSNYVNYATQNVNNPVCNNVASLNLTTTLQPLSTNPVYNNHTSQYTSLDPVCSVYQGTRSSTPPPAHEDLTTQHGFFPPPPPLPVPQFSQVCHKRSEAEFPDPNENKIYTNLQSKDESQTCSSLLHVNSMSPSREVLDLSLPKNGEELKVEEVQDMKVDGEEYQNIVLEPSLKPDSSSKNEETLEEKVEPKETVEPVKVETKEEVSEDVISFEPSSMPSMPEANISCPESQQKLLLDHDENTAGLESYDDYSGLMNPDEDAESRSQSPLQFDDPNRIDCKFCGMIFNAPHVRSFHEKGHAQEHEEYDGELTRLFCGFCGKTFKKATYRMLHEKGHTGELTICCQYCERRFRWESELKSHHKFCSYESPSKPQVKKKLHSTNRHIDKDDWVANHPSMPTGWKLRTRPRPTQEGQVYFIFLSPEGQVFHSRKSMLQQMEKTGGYSIEDLTKVRRSAKTGPRGRKGRGSGSGRDRSPDIDMDTSGSNLDITDLDSSDAYRKEGDSDEVEVEGSSSSWSWDETSLPAGWKVRLISQSSGEKKYEFLSPENHLFTTRKEVLNHVRRKKDGTDPEVEKPSLEHNETSPKRQRLVSNQMIITSRIKAMRRDVINNEELSQEAFNKEPVIFVPKILSLVKNMNLSEYESSDLPSVRIPINCIHSDEGLGNNTEEIKQELKERQIEFDNKGREEEDAEVGTGVPGTRTLRFRQRQNYEELDDDVFQALISKRLSQPPLLVAQDRSDEDTNNETKGKERNRFSEEETKMLEKWFDKNPYPTEQQRQEISEIMRISQKKVRIWFQNKRCKTDEGKIKCFFARNNIQNSEEDEESEEIDLDLISCSTCTQTFSSRTNFKIHHKRVHGSDIEIYECKECRKAFDTQWNLKTHGIEAHSKFGGYEYENIEGNGNEESGRTKFTKTQIVGLRNSFALNPYPDRDEYKKLETDLNVSNKILHSWFQNNRHREKITGQLYFSGHQDGLEDYTEDGWRHDDDDSRTRYNPGHKKTKFSDHQKYYLQSFFSEKEYVDEDDISDLSAELMLSPKVIRVWFQHARERKKKNLPIIPRGRGRGRGGMRGRYIPTGRGRGRPVKEKIEELDDGYFDLDDDSMSMDCPEGSTIEKISDKVSEFSSIGKDRFTEFQKVFLEGFYADIADPDSDDLDYLCEHVNASREKILEWFKERNIKQSENEAERICSEILNRLLDRINFDSKPSSSGYIDLGEKYSCPYCGKSFPEEHLLREHEKIEAIEFEKEAQKFKEAGPVVDDGVYVTLEDGVEESQGDCFDDIDDGSDSEDNYYSLEDDLDKDESSLQSSTVEDHVKRPLNPFMVWLQEERKKVQEGGLDRTSRSTGDLIRDLSLLWKSMSEYDKMPYIEESRRLKEIHKRDHPNYSFSPTRKRGSANQYPVKTSRRTNVVKSNICKRCHVGFTTKGNLFKHLRHFHPENPYDPNQYVLGSEKQKERNLRRCDRCNMDFISKIGLARHMLKAHKERQRDSFRSDYYDEDTTDSMSTDQFSHPRSRVEYIEPVTSSSDRFDSYEEDMDRKAHVKTRFTSHQRQVLLDSFHKSIYMSKCDAKEMYFSLSDRLQLPTKIIKIWFQNARSARKRGKPLFS